MEAFYIGAVVLFVVILLVVAYVHDKEDMES